MKKRIAISLAGLIFVLNFLIPFSAQAANPIWDKYIKAGSHKVSELYFTVDENDFTYRVWYPKDISKKTPIILYCNGTGSNYEKSEEMVNFMNITASHGFICVANTDENTGTGVSMDAGMTKLIEINSTAGNPLCGKIDINNVGLAGHSQGATCTINLSSKGKYANLKYYKAVFACSLPTPQLAESPLQNCPYDSTLATLPTLLVAGTGITDSGFICPLETSLKPAMSNIKNDTVMARMSLVEHADSICKIYPYMIAWFDYKLNKNTDAGKAFYGKNPELQTNTSWQEYKAKMYFKGETAVSKITPKKKSFKINFKNVSDVSGYEIQYSTNKKFPKKSTSSVSVKSTAKTVKKLKANKTYYVRVRPYRSLCGKKYYGKFSVVKSTKTK